MAKGKRLSEHFRNGEFSCRCSRTCNGKHDPDPRLIVALEWLRVLADDAVNVTTALGKNGGNRCAPHNRKVGGASRSQHIKNKAADIYVDGLTGLELAMLAVQVEPFRNGGVGIAKNHIHVDVRCGPARWDYASARGTVGKLRKFERGL